MSQQIFAFGSNMCSGRFRAHGVSPEGSGRAALLVGYCLVFNKKSADDESGKANVEGHENAEVWGVLYTVPDADLKKLDRGEGGYQRAQLPVRLTDNTNSEAWVYVAKKPSNDPALLPYTWYKRFLVEGAREHFLPEVYIAGLERIHAVQDTDQERDRRKRALACQAAMSAPEWHCEGNVVVAVVCYLKEEGWTIESVADTAARAHGADIRARKEGKTLIVEAKGYPLTVYARGENKGQPKPTKPDVQARHWYSHVLFDAILRQSKYPSASVAIALPDFPVFKSLIARTQFALSKLGIGVYLVRETGRVESVEFTAGDR
jgi:hypothetical protein